MNTSYTIETRDVRYKLHITGKYNVIVGDSRSGKTRLATLCDNIYRGAPTLTDPGIEIVGASTRTVTDIFPLLKQKEGALFVLDEEVLCAGGHALSDAILGSKNVFIFTTRERLAEIPYGISNIFELIGNDKHKRMVRKYSDKPIQINNVSLNDGILVEDTALGFDVAKAVLSYRGFKKIDTALNKDGFTNMFSKRNHRIAIIDLCGAGSVYPELADKAYVYGLFICTSKSFEWEMLTRALQFGEIDAPIEQLLEYRSEERMYEQLLNAYMRKKFSLSYSKNLSLSELPKEFKLNEMYPELFGESGIKPLSFL